MPAMLSYGAVGAVVKRLQSALNGNNPTQLARLAVDGQFGPRTLARVKEFQGQKLLKVDGIVGPNTWSKLLVKPTEIPFRTGVDCGTHERANLAIGKQVASQFVQFGGSSALVAQSGSPTARSQVTADDASGPFRLLTEQQRTTAKSVYGSSLDFSRIFLSDKTGAGGRPFTMAFPDSNQIVQILNVGSFNPGRNLLIHELCHAWQSQHHTDQFKFMKNSVACQADAVAANSVEVAFDPDVLLHHEHPVQFPFSAYAYHSGKSLSSYAAEQMANAVEHGDSKLVAHVKSVAMNTVDGQNVSALELVNTGDRREVGIKY